MLAKDLKRTVQRQGFDGPALSARRRGLEKRIVDCFFGRFDNGEKEWRRGVVAQGLKSAGYDRVTWIGRSDADVGGGREGDGIVATPVAGGGAGSGKAHHRARCQPAEIPRVERCVSRDHDDNGAVRRVSAVCWCEFVL